jgi:phage replication O-like protein O
MKKPYTQLENETMEALARAPFTAREFRVVLAIIRLTNGFHLTENRVGTKYLQQLTGMPRQHIQEVIRRLINKQVLARDKRGMVAVHAPGL